MLQKAEGVMKGHTLVLGYEADLRMLGHVNGLNDFREPLPDNMRISNDIGLEAFRRRMNNDGMTLINGHSGKPFCNNFFTQGTEPAESGGARTRSSQWITRMASNGAITLKISEDDNGKVTIMRSDSNSGQELEIEEYSGQDPNGTRG